MGPGFDPLARYVKKNDVGNMMDVYLVVVHDTIVQSREYCIMVPTGSSADFVKEKIEKGEFLTESEATFVEAIDQSRIISAEKVGEA